MAGRESTPRGGHDREDRPKRVPGSHYRSGRRAQDEAGQRDWRRREVRYVNVAIEAAAGRKAAEVRADAKLVSTWLEIEPREHLVLRESAGIWSKRDIRLQSRRAERLPVDVERADLQVHALHRPA